MSDDPVLDVLHARIGELIPTGALKFLSATQLCLTDPRITEGWSEELKRDVGRRLVETRPTREFDASMHAGSLESLSIREHVWDAMFGPFKELHKDITEAPTKDRESFGEFCLRETSVDVFRHVLNSCPTEVLMGDGELNGLHILAMSETRGRDPLIQEYLEKCPEAAKEKNSSGDCAFLLYAKTGLEDPSPPLTIEAFLDHTPPEWIAEAKFWIGSLWNAPVFKAALQRFPDACGPEALEGIIENGGSALGPLVESLMSTLPKESFLVTLENGWTLAHLSALVGSSLTFPLLEKVPSLASKLSPEGESVLAMALDSGSLTEEGLKTLIALSPKEVLSAAGKDQMTVLHFAALLGQENFARLLLDALEPNACNMRNSKGQTPSEVAAENGHAALAAILAPAST